MKLSLLAPIALASSVFVPSAHAVSFNFNESVQYTENFQRTYLETGSSGAFGFSNNALTHTSTGTGTAVVAYDTDPDTTPTNTFSDVTVGFDFSAATSNVSFGIYFGGASRTNSALAIFNLNSGGGTNDTLRFFTGGNMNTGGAGTQFGTTTTLTDGGFTTNTTYRASLTISYVTATTANATFTITDASNALSSFSATATGITVANAGEIAFRSGFSSGSSTNSNVIDNISITTSAIPEPSTYALLGGVGALGLALCKRRKRD